MCQNTFCLFSRGGSSRQPVNQGNNILKKYIITGSVLMPAMRFFLIFLRSLFCQQCEVLGVHLALYLASAVEASAIVKNTPSVPESRGSFTKIYRGNTCTHKKQNKKSNIVSNRGLQLIFQVW